MGGIVIWRLMVCYIAALLSGTCAHAQLLSPISNFGPPRCTQSISFVARTDGAGNNAAYGSVICPLARQGTLTKLDALYEYATNSTTNGALNLVQNAYNGSLASVTQIANYGIFQTASHDVDTGFNPTTAVTPNLILNSSSQFAWALNLLPAFSAGYGPNMGNTNNLMLTNFTGPVTDFRAGSATNISVTDTWSGANMYGVTRTASASVTTYHNATSNGATSGSSSALTNADFVVLQDGLSHYTANTVAMAGFGSALTATDFSNIFSAERAYLRTIGAIAAPFNGTSGGTFFTASNTTTFVNVGWIDAGAHLQFAKAQAWTIIAAVWIPAGIVFPVAQPAGLILGNCGVAPFTGYEFWMGTGNVLRSRLINNFGTNVYSGAIGSLAVPTGQWAVVAETYDGSGSAAGINFYVNGVLDTGVTTEGLGLAATDIVSTNDLLVGAQQNSTNGSAPTSVTNVLAGGTVGANQSSYGALGGLYMSNIVRSQSYIATVTASSLPAVDANTVLYYTLAEGTGTTTADSSSNNFTGTLHTGGMWLP